MIIIFIRATIIFLILLIIMRLMGKRQIGEMQPFEFIITLVISDLACIPMADVSIPLLYGISAILALFVFHQFVTILDQKSKIFKKIISGKPTVVINRFGVDFSQLKKNSLDLSDLIEAMRGCGYFSLDDLDYGIFEANGKFSALEKTDLNKENKTLPLLFINEGKIDMHNLQISHFSYNYIIDLINKFGCKKLKDVLVMTVDSLGKVYFQQKDKPYETFNIELPEDSSW